MQLYTKILIGLVAGAVFGAIANLGEIAILQNIFSEIEILGTAFINLITISFGSMFNIAILYIFIDILALPYLPS